MYLQFQVTKLHLQVVFFNTINIQLDKNQFHSKNSSLHLLHQGSFLILFSYQTKAWLKISIIEHRFLYSYYYYQQHLPNSLNLPNLGYYLLVLLQIYLHYLHLRLYFKKNHLLLLDLYQYLYFHLFLLLLRKNHLFNFECCYFKIYHQLYFLKHQMQNFQIYLHLGYYQYFT